MDVDTGYMRITIRVRPGSARPGVGGEHDGALVVRVSARAVDGKATEAALTAVARSFGVRRSCVRLVSGASARTKIVDIDADDPRVLASLLAAPNRLRPRRDAAVVRQLTSPAERVIAGEAWPSCCGPRRARRKVSGIVAGEVSIRRSHFVAGVRADQRPAPEDKRE
jgi:uncharacterized protein YggU (UPF0235/DUF167 family)